MAYAIKKKACAVAGAALIGAFVLGKYTLNTSPTLKQRSALMVQSHQEHSAVHYSSPQQLFDQLGRSEEREIITYVLDQASLGTRWHSFSDDEKVYLLKQGISELNDHEKNNFLNDYFEDAALARGKSALRRAESALQYATTSKDSRQSAPIDQQQKNQSILEERLR